MIPGNGAPGIDIHLCIEAIAEVQLAVRQYANMSDDVALALSVAHFESHRGIFERAPVSYLAT
jgi:hypothetical protein